MSYGTILIVEDEEDIQELISFNLKSKGYETTLASTGREALEGAKTKNPDLIILDIMIPDLDGFEVCRRLKQDVKTQGIPIIMVTARGEESDVVTGLELGADDYLTKPFSPKILTARVRSVLRRTSDKKKKSHNALIEHGELSIDVGKHQILLGNNPVLLSATEFAILLHLASNPGWVFTRNQIIDSVKGEDYPVTDRSVDVQILGIRKKLGNWGDNIETVRGVGYRLRSLD